MQGRKRKRNKKKMMGKIKEKNQLGGLVWTWGVDGWIIFLSGVWWVWVTVLFSSLRWISNQILPVCDSSKVVSASRLPVSYCLSHHFCHISSSSSSSWYQFYSLSLSLSLSQSIYLSFRIPYSPQLCLSSPPPDTDVITEM